MTVHQAVIELAVQEIGYESVYDYAAEKLRDSMLAEIKISLDAIALFEKKYGLDYIRFRSQFFELTQFPLFEREDDGMDWSAELEQLRLLEKRLAQLLPNAISCQTGTNILTSGRAAIISSFTDGTMRMNAI